MLTTSRPSDKRRGFSRATGYTAALATCAAIGLLQYLLLSFVSDRFLLAALPGTVLLAAWLGGFGPGLLATCAGTLTAAYFLQLGRIVPVDDPAHIASVLIFALIGVLTSLAIHHLWREARVERDARTEAERQLRQADRLQQLTATLSRAKTPSDVLRTGLPELLHAADATAGAVFLISDDGGEIELAHAVGYPDSPATPADRIPLASHPRLREALRGREPVALDPNAGSGTPPGPVAVPLVTAGRAIGAVTLNLPARSADDREFLIDAGSHTAHALARARLYDTADRERADAEALRVRADSELRERQKAEEALRLSEGRYRALAARTSRLYALSAGLSEAVSIDAVARTVVREGKLVAGAAAGSVEILVDGGAQFEMLYQEEWPPDSAEPRHRFPAGAGLCSTAVVDQRRPVFVRSFAEWQDKYPRSASLAAGGGYTSAAALPLLSDGNVFGVLSFHFTVPVNFDDEYTALLKAIAQHGAQALDRARLYESAERARADAEAANRSKDDFLSTISHELRTPLNAMLGWAAMLRNGSIDAARTQRAIEAIFNNATRQGRLIEELLDVSRIVAGRASLDLQDMDLSENIRGAVEAMMPIAASKGVELQCNAPPSVPIVADPRRLEQVFLNLLANAVKFTPPDGHVAIDVALSEQSVQVRVTDTGAGIDPEFLPHVFERFRQGDSTTTRGVGGLGLGLFIARQLVEAQGGTIRVESEGAGRGAVFTVTLPSATGAPAGRHAVADGAAAAANSLDASPALHGLRILLVDDEADTREMMASALEACGATVIAAASAHDALQTLARTPIDLLLSDIAMPGQDGYELIREIRAMSSTRLAGLPAAAVTAHARDDERELALAAGFQMHLTKPIHPEALARAVASLALSRPASMGRPANSQAD